MTIEDLAPSVNPRSSSVLSVPRQQWAILVGVRIGETSYPASGCIPAATFARRPKRICSPPQALGLSLAGGSGLSQRVVITAVRFRYPSLTQSPGTVAMAGLSPRPNRYAHGVSGIVPRFSPISPLQAELYRNARSRIVKELALDGDIHIDKCIVSQPRFQSENLGHCGALWPRAARYQLSTDN